MISTAWKKEGEAFVDSTLFDGYEFLYRTSEPAMKERVPIDATHFRPGDIYRADRVRESYRHLVGLKVFQSIDISFKPDPRDSTMTDLVAQLRLSPMPLNTFTTELKGTNTAGNFGIGGGVGLIKRNFTGRGELLNISLRGAIEAQYNSRYSDDFFNTRELGAEIGLELPKFLVPFNSYGLIPKRMRPSSSLAFETLWQERAEYTRICSIRAWPIRGTRVRPNTTWSRWRIGAIPMCRRSTPILQRSAVQKWI